VTARAARIALVGRTVRFAPTFDGWRSAARDLLRDGVHPETVAWEPEDDAQPGLDGLALHAPTLTGDEAARPVSADDLRVSRNFLRLAASVSCHRSADRWAMLYQVLWRLVGREPHLLEVVTDPAVHALGTMDRAVRRAAHKMKAFVRFRRTGGDDETDPVYVAWFEPAHRVVERTAPFFAERFPSMRWSILTPDACAHWDRESLRITPGVVRAMAPTGDDLEALWRTYYAHIFNPARLNLDAMRAEMPRQYWALLPEAALIGDLAREAPRRVAAMLAETMRTPEALPADLEGRGVPAEPTAAADALHDPGALIARERERRVTEHAPAGLSHENGGRVQIGVAGWTDPSLMAAGVFYPDHATTPEARLRYYASRFPLVEVDATYYALPTRSMAERWVERTPAGFVFDIKAHALMTGHGTEVSRLPSWIAEALPQRLRGATRVFPGVLPPDIIDEVWRRFLDALEPLRAAGKLGSVLLQYPPWFKPSPESADAIRAARRRLGATLGAVEFRQRGWLAGRVADRSMQLLEELDLAYVMVDAPQGMESSVPPAIAITSPKLAVVRLHGRRTETWERRNDVVSERYRYLYDERQLGAWTVPIIDIAKRHQGVHVLFNNNHANYATTNALEMSELLVGAGLKPRRT
jgi:probable DNA metabolism protein